MYKVDDICNWFLQYNKYLSDVEGEDTDLISNLKLQKLLYYAQGTVLALTGSPLFKEKIYAWRHGPVVESMYQKYREYGGAGITTNDKIEEVIDIDTENILKDVYSTFGKYSAWGLRNLTHSETPWLETEINDVISTESIKTYFIENYIE